MKQIEFFYSLNLTSTFRNGDVLGRFLRTCAYIILSIPVQVISASVSNGTYVRFCCWLFSLQLKCSSRVVHNLASATKLSKGGTASLNNRGLRRLPRSPSLISTPEFAVYLLDKAHVMKMKLSWILPIWASSSAGKLLYFLEARDLLKFNYV